MGGSDDHSALNIARTYTRIEGVALPRLLRPISRGLALEVVSHAATPLTMAHNLYGIAYQYYRNKFSLNRYADKDALMRFLDRNLRTDANRQRLDGPDLLALEVSKGEAGRVPVSDSLLTLLRHETWQLIQDDPETDGSGPGRPAISPEHEQHWFDFVNRVSNGS